jgi:CheY-like chemotaxis protein
MTTASSSSGPPPALSERVIIVVDDDATLRSLTSSYLRRAGATVHLAENGREALTLITDLHSSGTAVHAVLCDLRMEGGTGMELFQRVGETLPALAPRMIFSSGDIDSDDVRSFVERGDVRVLAKPYPLAELRRLLTELPPPPLS